MTDPKTGQKFWTSLGYPANLYDAFYGAGTTNLLQLVRVQAASTDEFPFS